MLLNVQVDDLRFTLIQPFEADWVFNIIKCSSFSGKNLHIMLLNVQVGDLRFTLIQPFEADWVFNIIKCSSFSGK